MLKRIVTLGLFVTAWCVGSSPARASFQTYTLSNVAITRHTTGNGLLIQTALNQSLPYTFGLDDGQSHTFSLFDIWTNEGSLEPDDLAAKPFGVALTFAAPPPGGATPTIGGQTVGVSVLFGFIQVGQLTWNSTNPSVVTVGDYSYSVALTPGPTVSFNGGLFGLIRGRNHGATVYATVTQLDSPVAAPEPATLASLAIGGACFAGYGLRRKGRANPAEPA
jgi:hypothetical protein